MKPVNPDLGCTSSWVCRRVTLIVKVFAIMVVLMVANGDTV